MELPVIAAALPAFGWALHSSLLARRLSTARRDPLTGLHTRAGWTTRAERIATRSPHALALLVDLDDFKAISDTHGHAAGDAVLTATAGRLAAWSTRHGIAARLGGDEFAAIITDPAHTPGTNALHEALHHPVNHRGRLIPVAASVGICHLADLPARTLTDALSAADTAMYAVKGRGRRNNTPRP
ncbi:GGDEF domain-containing protein [Streptomyces brevispora]|uniref:GGDEF domain-containing protein n=1 Tax=Streptomyces brevispora TaxID=887462 RepID=UPI002E300400|nr:GGDEF domain-containing protein [Streptomyces brevispora]